MKRFLFLGIAFLLVLAACDTNGSLQETSPTATLEQSTADAQTARPDLELRVEDALAARAAEDDPEANAQAFIALMNEQLAEDGLNVAIQKAEWITSAVESNEAGQTVLANDRELRLESQWVPGDERRNADGDNITHVTWEPFAPANYGTPDQFDAASIIDASLKTWDGVNCSKLDIETLVPTYLNPSAILGGDPFQADIVTVGFMPPLYFELFVGTGTSGNVLGVTFTFVFVDEDDNPTDINDDGYTDVAHKEVWYNDAFQWAEDPSEGVDTETIALHENGHALGLGHFGKISITDKNGKLHVSPEAVMNAAYLGGATHEPLGTDNSAYCGLYASWAK